VEDAATASSLVNVNGALFPSRGRRRARRWQNHPRQQPMVQQQEQGNALDALQREPARPILKFATARPPPHYLTTRPPSYIHLEFPSSRRVSSHGAYYYAGARQLRGAGRFVYADPNTVSQLTAHSCFCRLPQQLQIVVYRSCRPTPGPQSGRI
jgi:hypothetical protein